ncbi:cell adhesion molecule DSCAM-like [Macrobrachium rosenbergii]|uniref:cell adhesion molecule DSCAM-like n=1 Tax=Macrobrachium rosenbergii TaxID=79674 RepID=UPI0034D52C61
MRSSAFSRAVYSRRLYPIVAQLLLIGAGFLTVWADNQLDSHEIDYIPKMVPSSPDSLQRDSSSGKTAASTSTYTAQTHDYPSLIKEILNSHKQQQQKKRPVLLDVHDQNHIGLQSGNFITQSNREIPDQSYTTKYATGIPQVANNVRYTPNTKPLFTVPTIHQSVSDDGGSLNHKVRHGDSFHSGIVYSGGSSTQYGAYKTNEVYTGAWVYGTPLEEGLETEETPEPVISIDPLGPRFDRSLPRNVTVHKGERAVLSCKVVGKTGNSVSWIRHEDLHILSVNNDSYTSDSRISIRHQESPEDDKWILTIEEVAEQDAGMYECQVSTKPVLSFIVNLLVIIPKAEILNGPEIFVHKGSLINLTCVVTHGTEKPVFVYWFHHNKILDYEGRGGVTVNTIASRDTVSYLVMRNAIANDSGIYGCKPSIGEDSLATLHVLNGEHQAAMQINGSSKMTMEWKQVLTSLVAVLWYLSWIRIAMENEALINRI